MTPPPPSQQPEPTEATSLSDVPLEQVSIVLLAGKPRARSLRRWLSAWQEDPDLLRCPVIMLYRDTDRARMEARTSSLPTLTLWEMPSAVDSDQGDSLSAYAALFEQISTPFFCVSTMPRRRGRYAQSLKTRIAREYARIGEVGLTSDHSIMMYNRQRRTMASRAYVWHTLARLGSEISPLMRDYLGFLALASGTHKLEGIDLRSNSGSLELFARSTAGRFNSELKPPWSYRYAVVGPSRTVLTEQRAILQQRLDNQGGRRWENLIGRLPLNAIPEGNHRLMVGLDTAYPPLATLQELQPRPGALAPARTVVVPGEATDGTRMDTRYLIHTVEGSRSWITVQRGSGPSARRRWANAMVKKDARQVIAGEAGRRMRLARLQRLATMPRFARRSIWLIGERADTAQDNGYHLFRHLREQHPEREAYYIIDADSPQYERVAGMGNVVAHSSWQHQLLMMHAEVLANAYSIKHMIPRQWTAASYTRGLAWRVGAQRVYLKHGVHVSPTAVKRGTGGYDLYLSVNPAESYALRASSGYRDQVVETGMPRYDTLVPGPSSRTILFMPTWRRYLVPKLFGGDSEAQTPFEGSTYERFMRGLLCSPRLHEMLTRYDYRLQVLPHYNLRQELEDFELDSDRTEFADTTANTFQELITGCDAFVTDYSSVHFDVAYLDTPIIYTHFDRREYEEGHAVVSWFDHETDGFGPVVHSAEETLDALEELLARGCAQDPAYASRVRQAFTFHDHDNCARVVQEIDALVGRPHP